MAFISQLVFEPGRGAMPLVQLQRRHAEFEHEQVTATVPARLNQGRFTRGTPVAITWGTQRDQRRFIGYIDHARPTYEVYEPEQTGRHIDLVCFAPSWVLKEGGHAGYEYASILRPLRDIAARARFDTAELEANPYLWTQLFQGGQSAWQFASGLAQQVGHTLFARGVTLHCQTRQTALRRWPRGVPQLTEANERTYVSGGVVRRGIPTAGGAQVAQDGFGVNPRTGAVIEYRAHQSAGTFGTGASEAVSSSFREAEQRLLARQAAMPIRAEIEIHGHAGVEVGGPVFDRAPSGSFGGLWYVQQVIEEFSRDRWRMDLSVGRDEQLPMPTGHTGYGRGSRLVNGRWVLA